MGIETFVEIAHTVPPLLKNYYLHAFQKTSTIKTRLKLTQMFNLRRVLLALLYLFKFIVFNRIF